MPFEGRIKEIWAQVDASHLTIWSEAEGFRKVAIPAGKGFELKVVTEAEWPDNPEFSTAYTIGGGDIDYGDALIDGRDFTFSRNVVMPNKDLNLGRIRFWKSPVASNTPPPSGDR